MKFQPWFKIETFRSFNLFTAFFLVASFLLIVLIGQSIDYSTQSQHTFFLMGTFNYLLIFIEGLAGFCLLLMSLFLFFTFYSELKYYTSVFYAGASLWIFLAFGVIYFIPGILYLNNFILLTHVCGAHIHELSSVIPDLCIGDFITSLMDNGSNQASTKAPSMNGHLVVGGTHEGKRYACVDILGALNTSIENQWAKTGAKLGKSLFSIPDIYCVGELPKFQYPDTNKTK